MGELKLSVVIATYNRGAALGRLLNDLAIQREQSFEVIVVDDGSLEPAEKIITRMRLPYPIGVVWQANRGPGAARHVGIGRAKAPIIVILDDDMHLGGDFLTQHLASHEAGADVVLGYIAPPSGALPFFERFHADQLERFAAAAASGALQVRGVHLCTGNVSFKKAAYEQVGGFDATLGHSEDRELGVRFEKAGLRLTFNPLAKTMHVSPRADLDAWLSRSFKYGVFDSRISVRHPELEIADPWRFLFRVHPLTRPFALAVVAAPQLAKPLAHAGVRVAQLLERVGLERPTMMATTFAYGMQYFGGVRTEAGGLRRAARNFLRYLDKRKEHGSAG